MMILDEAKLYEILQKHFPEKNDYFKSDYKEELYELKEFGIQTTKELEKLIEKHINQINCRPTVRSAGYRGLSRMKGNFLVRFLGATAEQSARSTRTPN